MLTIVKNFDRLVIIFVYGGSSLFSIKHHKLKRRVDQKKRKRLEILKNHLG